MKKKKNIFCFLYFISSDFQHFFNNKSPSGGTNEGLLAEKLLGNAALMGSVIAFLIIYVFIGVIMF